MNDRGTHIALVSVLFVLFSILFVGGVGAQSGASSAGNQGAGPDSSENADGQSKVIKIDLDHPLTRELRRFSSGVKPPEQTEIQFNGGKNRPWSFVKFDPLSEHTSITVKDKPQGYDESEQLKPGTWYPFKTMLPIVFNIDSNAKAPVQLKFWVGYAPAGDERFTANQPTSKVLELAQESVTELTNVQVLAFYWGPSVINIEPTTLAFAPGDTSKTITLKGDSRLWTMVRLPALPEGIQATLNTASADDLTSKLQAPLKANEWIGFKGSATLEIQLDRSKVNVESNSTTIDIETAIDPQQGQTKNAVNAEIDAGKITSNGNTHLSVSWDQPDRRFLLIPLIVVVGIILLGILGFALWKRLPERTSTVRTTPSGVTVFDSRKDKKRNRDGHHEYGDNARRLTQPINPASAPALFPIAPVVPQPTSPLTNVYPMIQMEDLDRVKTDLQHQITTLKADLKNQVTFEYVNQRLSNLQTDINTIFQGKLNEGLNGILEEVARLDQDQKASKPDLSNLQTRLDTISTENVNRIRDIETHLTSELDQLQKMVVEQAFPESYFARTMGMILSKNILELHEGNLERLIGEAVNNFFQTDVPRSESLQELRQRAESIIATLKNVLEIVSCKKPEVEHEIRLRFGRAEALLAKISDSQNQLQSRKLTLETTLRIPVSAYAGARQTLIEELGRGIRSELDKLANPQNYFEGDLERLVTADVIAIVDICDKKVSLPVGSDPEVESILQQLFLHAGLRSILPSPGEPFGTAEQDLVQMVPAIPGTSMTIADVVTRGFYYTHRENETLLRKAAVIVSR